MKSFEKLLTENKKWASDKQKIDPNFFKHLAKEQKPDFLWIGCSDSRVPAELIVNAEPGEMFIHRNIANQMVATDFNCLSVLQYAVAVLKVKHIIVCGHYNCGGVKAALNNQSTDLVLTNKWLMHIKNVYRLHQKEVNALATEQERIDRLVELNVIEQVKTLAYTSIIQQAWHKENRPIIHGWVYGLSDGLLKTLISMEPGHEIEPIFKYDYTEAVA
ncbi:MAG: carbonic anhydrase [Gammaproteobacteria bacterium HGW-Gammaproteobacteria-10]|nr:MAG: carbonic anhydrase [Gammaproteobacteria bacterium HGW-Gammaproteobacteria-10]